MAPKPTTNFTGLKVTGNDANSTDGLYAPVITTAKRDAINLPAAKKLGCIIYNLTNNRFEIYNSNGWTPITGGAGNGDVSGPNESTPGAVPLFADNTGKILEDSGVDIKNVFTQQEGSVKRAGGLELSGLTYLKFSSESSAIYVDALTGIQFITNDFGLDSQVCSLLTSGLPSSSTSPNALLELQSTTGAFLMSRMTSTQRNALIPSNGMILYNTTTNKVEAYVNDLWTTLSSGGSGGDVSGPNVSIANDIAVFADNSGKVLSDSGASISIASQTLSEGEALANVNQLNGLGSLNFTGSGSLKVDEIPGIQLINNNFGSGTQICSLLGSSSASTSPSALLELQSTTGAFLPSRMTSTQRNALIPSNGMILYNTTTNKVEAYVNDLWTTLSSGGSGGGDVSGPDSSVANNLSVFSDSSGKIIKDSSLNVSINDGNLLLSPPDSSDHNSCIGIGFGAISNVALSTGNIGIGNRAFTGGSQDDPVQATGEGNIAIGGFSLYRNVLANNTISIGVGSLSYMDSGDGNICIGSGSGTGYLAPSYTVVIGTSAANNRAYDQNCVYIGAKAQNISGKSAFAGLINAVAIGAGSEVLTNNSMTLGKGINVGIGNSSAAYALDIGAENGITPLIRMSPTSTPAAPPNLNEGIYFNNNGRSSYKSFQPGFSGNLVNANSSDSNAPTCGFIEYLPGKGQQSLVVNTTAVRANSIILTTIYSANPNGPSLTGGAIITNITPSTSFSIQGNYTPSGPSPSAYWLIINPS